MNNPTDPRIVVFGASGFLGTALIERLHLFGRRNIVAVSRNEGALCALAQRFDFVTIMPGDIADPWVVQKAMNGADEVYHLAAMKHVGLAEQEVRSCISSNIIGTSNVVEASLHTKPGLLVFISTDKAAQPSGVYGCTKKIGERLIAEAEKMNPATQYRIVRYGNVWGSTGSIITKWKPKIEKGQEVILTDPEASRFFWTVDESVDCIFDAIDNGTSAEPWVPKMKAVKMGVVLEACIDTYGPPGVKVPIKIIGLQPGENRTETTDGVHYSDQVAQFSKSEFIYKFLKA